MADSAHATGATHPATRAGPGEAGRRAEIAAGLARTRRRIATACADVGRDPADVTLIVVTKTFPPSDVGHLVALGVHDVGENRHPEAGDKARASADLDLRWHFVGQLQTNKARAVAGYADVVHSVDRPRLVDALARARDASAPLDCLIQVSLDPAEQAAGRGGAAPSEIEALAEHITGCASLRLRGLMAVAPLGSDARRAFADLQSHSVALRDTWPEADWVSAGMSGDLEDALRHGATHVRVGSAILGSRPPAG